MANKNLYHIEGLDECVRFMDQVPDYLLKVTKAALKAGGKKGAQILRQRVPARWRRLVAYKLSKGQISQDTYLMMGYFNKGRRRASKRDGTVHEIPDWFKAYWKDYGTLARRDPEHHFETPVQDKVNVLREKNGKKGRYQNYRFKYRHQDKGQFPEHIYEEASEGLEQIIHEEFCKYMKAHEEDLYG